VLLWFVLRDAASPLLSMTKSGGAPSTFVILRSELSGERREGRKASIQVLVGIGISKRRMQPVMLFLRRPAS